MADERIEVNRAWWDEAAVDHFERTYDLGLLRAGGSTLHPIEAAELPADLSGQRVCHLQCHIGPDTLSLARRGAEVVGLDFSPEAIARARSLAVELGIAATFVESTVQDARAALDGDFDGVFATWGALVWLPDLDEWAGIVASLLRPGGWLYLAEGHPYALSLAYPELPYGGSQHVTFDEQGDYMDSSVVRTNTITHEYSHGLGEIATAVAGAGLHLDWLHEHDGLTWAMASTLERGDDGLYRRPGSDLPLSFSLRATKPGTR
ncbi:MAG: putative SAM-dependent methyltransferase [Actinomycetia bacterium]|nr:putative SAM-dependent methyltransferase [Actinomycetes bacterium]